MGEVAFKTGAAPAAPGRASYAARYDAVHQLPSTLDLLVDIFEENANALQDTGIEVTVVRTDAGALEAGVYVIKAVSGTGDLPSGVTSELQVFKKVADPTESTGFILTQVSNTDGSLMEVNELLARAIVDTAAGRKALYQTVKGIGSNFSALTTGGKVIDITKQASGALKLIDQYASARAQIAAGYMNAFCAAGKTSLNDFDADSSLMRPELLTTEFDAASYTPTGQPVTTVVTLRDAYSTAHATAKQKFDTAKDTSPQTEQSWNDAYTAALEAHRALELFKQAVAAARAEADARETAAQQKGEQLTALKDVLPALPAVELNAICTAASGNVTDAKSSSTGNSISYAEARTLILDDAGAFVALGAAYLALIEKGDLTVMPASAVARQAIAAALQARVKNEDISDARVVSYTMISRATGKKETGTYLGLFVKEASGEWTLSNPPKDVPADRDIVGRAAGVFAKDAFTITETDGKLAIEMNPTWANRQCRVDNSGAIVGAELETALAQANAAVNPAASGAGGAGGSGSSSPSDNTVWVNFISPHGTISGTKLTPEQITALTSTGRLNTDDDPEYEVELSDGLTLAEWKALGLGTDAAFLLWAQSGRASSLNADGTVKGDKDKETITLAELQEMDEKTIQYLAGAMEKTVEEVENEYLVATGFKVVDREAARERLMGGAENFDANTLYINLSPAAQKYARVVLNRILRTAGSAAASGASDAPADDADITIGTMLTAEQVEQFFAAMAFLMQIDDAKGFLGAADALIGEEDKLPELTSSKIADLMRALFKAEYIAAHERLVEEKKSAARTTRGGDMDDVDDSENEQTQAQALETEIQGLDASVWTASLSDIQAKVAQLEGYQQRVEALSGDRFKTVLRGQIEQKRSQMMQNYLGNADPAIQMEGLKMLREFWGKDPGNVQKIKALLYYAYTYSGIERDSFAAAGSSAQKELNTLARQTLREMKNSPAVKANAELQSTFEQLDYIPIQKCIKEVDETEGKETIKIARLSFVEVREYFATVGADLPDTFVVEFPATREAAATRALEMLLAYRQYILDNTKNLEGLTEANKKEVYRQVFQRGVVLWHYFEAYAQHYEAGVIQSEFLTQLDALPEETLPAAHKKALREKITAEGFGGVAVEDWINGGLKNIQIGAGIKGVLDNILNLKVESPNAINE